MRRPVLTYLQDRGLMLRNLRALEKVRGSSVMSLLGQTNHLGCKPLHDKLQELAKVIGQVQSEADQFLQSAQCQSCAGKGCMACDDTGYHPLHLSKET